MLYFQMSITEFKRALWDGHPLNYVQFQEWNHQQESNL